MTKQKHISEVERQGKSILLALKRIEETTRALSKVGLGQAAGDINNQMMYINDAVRYICTSACDDAEKGIALYKSLIPKN